MSRFEKYSVGIGLATGFVAAVTFISATVRDIGLSLHAEKRDWAKSSIIEIFEENDQLSFSDLYKEFSTDVVDQGRDDMTEEELRRALQGLMETDVIAYNSERNYFLKREPYFESEEKQSERQKEILVDTIEDLTEAQYQQDPIDEFSIVAELELRILHVLGSQSGKWSRDELAGQTDRYFVSNPTRKQFSFSDYSSHISKMVDVGKLHADEQRKIWRFKPLSKLPKVSPAAGTGEVESTEETVSQE